ncbi:partial Serine protease AprX, partial [Phycisphaerales bacterium]
TTAWNQGADLATNSIGTNVSNNGFSCTWYGDYGTCAAVIDSIIRGSNVTQGNPFRVTWAAGNERTTSRCATPTGYFYLGPPAGAKNQMCIGSVDSNSDNLSNFSSVGPTDDGRMRPDFCAPGCQVGGDGGVTSCTSSSDTAYASLCGTSMATPTAAGCAALLMQDFRANFPAEPDPRNSLLKVLFAQSAADRGNPGPDFFYGYGSIRVQNAVDLLRMGNFQESQVAQGDDVSLDITVPAGQTDLAITLAWDDAPAAGNANPVLVNDLDLEVFAPNSGPQAFPWTLSQTTPSANAERTQANRKDNIEQVKVENPAAGVWHVRVHGFNVPVGPQPFSIVASHQMSGGQPIPRITMSANQLTSEINSGVTAQVAANVVIQNDTIVPGTALLHYRPTSAAAWSEVALTNTSGDIWAATLPGFPCSANPEYYFTVTGAAFGLVSLPTGGASAPYGATIGVTQYFANDDFETDQGWVGGLPTDTANTGIWNRGVPESTSAQPGSDHTAAPGTSCWATDTRAGVAASQFDVDGGFTTLQSPEFDLSSQPEAMVSWWWWYSNDTGGGAGANEDRFRVRVSNDGTTWVAVESIGPVSPQPQGWRFSSYRVADFVTPNSTVSFSFVAVDLGAVSTVEAAIDDFVIKHHTCQDPPTCDPDVNCDGAVNGFDVQATEEAVNGDFSNFCQSSADLNGDGTENGFDIETEEQRVNGAPC